jgi:integrase
MSSDQPCRSPGFKDYWICSEEIGWHTLLHSFASSLHRNGEGIKVVQELLRHSSARITLDIYAHAVSADKRKAQSRVLADFMPELTSA